MPPAAGDIFVCRRIGMVAPPVHRVTPSQRPAPVHVHRHWLILALCPACIESTQHYCHEHNTNNWWLRTMATKPR